MKFKITSKKPDGSVLTHIYDNLTHDIETGEGIPIFLDQDPRLKHFTEKPFTDSSSEYKDTEKVALRITLGFDCNFHCKYCIESNVVVNAKPEGKVIPIKAVEIDNNSNSSKVKEERLSVEERAERLVKKITANIKSVDNICFWGGEPLVYLKIIKALVPKLKEAYPRVQLNCITNGSLFTKEVAQYFLDNNIHVTCSHDGPSFNVYRDDKNPLDNPKTLEGLQYYAKEILKQNMQLSMNCVVTPDNSDLSKIYPYFQQYFGDDFYLNFESIVKLSTKTKPIIKEFDAETKRNLITQLVAYGSTPKDDHPYNSIRREVTRLIKLLVAKKLPKANCFIRNKRAVAVNMNGDLLICHGSGETFGTLDTIKTSKFPDERLSYWAEREECKKCPVLASCLGQCIMASEEDRKASCDNYLIWHSGIFLAAWKLLFGSLITRIEPLEE